MNKRWRNTGLYVLLVVVVIVLATAFFEQSGSVKPERWIYSKFINEVEQGRIENVTITSDKSTASFASPDEAGQRVIVNLAQDADLVDTLTRNNVDITVQPSRDDSALARVFTALIFPVLLLVALFFIFRRASNGPGSQAMNFGKSKARVQMEPQTQVTFGDVAGIDQAKLELTE
ncbi:MAG: ATP-dependent metallopeptidase FtsH/Yme1/Tma family protein, partial [Cyanobacteria bacterium P01_F01_bin.3]